MVSYTSGKGRQRVTQAICHVFRAAPIADVWLSTFILWPLGVLSLHGTFYILYVNHFQRVGWLVTSGRLWGRNSVPSLYIFDRELMKGSGSVSWDSCGCECSKCVSYVFICISLCFIIQFMFISSEIFWVRLGRIQFYCSACEKISCSVLFFCWKGFMSLCPFHFLQQSIHVVVPQTKLLHFPPTLPHWIICAFIFNSLFFAEHRSHNIPKARSFHKIVSRIPIHLLAYGKHCIVSHLRPFSIIYLLSVTRREPSPALVELATRLSVVCGYPNFCLPSA